MFVFQILTETTAEKQIIWEELKSFQSLNTAPIIPVYISDFYIQNLKGFSLTLRRATHSRWTPSSRRFKCIIPSRASVPPRSPMIRDILTSSPLCTS